MTMPGRKAPGFTLLEMLVVLALVALATGIVVPRMAGWMDSIQERGWRADLRAYLAALPVRAFLAGDALNIDAVHLAAAVPGAPAGTNIRLKQPLTYSATGVASGGQLELERAGGREVWSIEAVSGRVDDGS